MDTLQIKKKLIDEINQSNNTDLLEEFYNFLNLEKHTQEAYQLNAEQNAAITEARNQIKRGEFLSNAEADQAIDQWLEK